MSRVRAKHGGGAGTVEVMPKRLASCVEATGKSYVYVRWDTGWCCLIDPNELERVEPPLPPAIDITVSVSDDGDIQFLDKEN